MVRITYDINVDIGVVIIVVTIVIATTVVVIIHIYLYVIGSFYNDSRRVVESSYTIGVNTSVFLAFLSFYGSILSRGSILFPRSISFLLTLYITSAVVSIDFIITYIRIIVIEVVILVRVLVLFSCYTLSVSFFSYLTRFLNSFDSFLFCLLGRDVDSIVILVLCQSCNGSQRAES